jgi:hypothetical protein
MRALAANIKALRLLRRKATFERLDVTPWIAIYGAAIAIALGANADRWVVSPWICFVLSLVAHGFSTLFKVWSMKWNVLMRYAEVMDLSQADFVLVEPVPHSGSAAVVPLLREPVADGRVSSTEEDLPAFNEDGTPVVTAARTTSSLSGSLSIPSWLPSSPVRFEYQSMPFHLARIVSTATPSSSLAFVPISCPDRAPLKAYSSWGGWSHQQEVEAAERKWGKNAVEVPPPTFGQLLKEQALAPFFVFQIFSVGLWMLDEVSTDVHRAAKQRREDLAMQPSFILCFASFHPCSTGTIRSTLYQPS